MKIIRTLIAMTIGLAALTAAACSNEPQAQPAVPNTPLPPPTVEVVPTSTLTPTTEPLTIRPSAQTQSQPQQPAQPPVQTQQQVPIPTQPPPMPVIPTQFPSVPTAPPPTPTVAIVEVPTVAMILPTETTVPTQQPTVEPTAEPTPTEIPPTATMVPPTPEPTATEIPLPVATPTPTDTSAPYIIVVDFYAGNVTRDPGSENCNPTRCGGVLIQFSEPVFTNPDVVIDIRTKGLLTCVEGCSTSQPSPYILFSGKWIAPKDDIIDSMILNAELYSITDTSGNPLESYHLGPITARVSDYSMIEGPTPVPTPIPESTSNEAPRVRRVIYDDSTLHLHLTEPVNVNFQKRSDIGVIVKLADGGTARGICNEPCQGDSALLSFNVPELAPDSIAKSLDLKITSSIQDRDGLDIDPEFEYISLAQIPKIEYIKIEELSGYDNWWGVTIEFHQDVTPDATDIYVITDGGVVLTCWPCAFGPDVFGELFTFSIDPVVFEANPVDISNHKLQAIVLVDGLLLGETGQVADTSFEPIPIQQIIIEP